jgi:hypothetical protein
VAARPVMHNAEHWPMRGSHWEGEFGPVGWCEASSAPRTAGSTCLLPHKGGGGRRDHGGWIDGGYAASVVYCAPEGLDTMSSTPK